MAGKPTLKRLTCIPKKKLNSKIQATDSNGTSNTSMDVTAKQLLSYQTYSLNFMLRVDGFAPRHLNR
jgi:hypothetical protein